MNYLTLKDLNAYKLSFELSNYVWNIVIGWDYFGKDTVGKQFVRSVDSISANIAEGFGRFYKKDKLTLVKIGAYMVFHKDSKALTVGDTMNIEDGQLIEKNTQIMNEEETKKASNSIKLMEYNIENVIYYHRGIFNNNSNQKGLIEDD